MKRMVLAYTIAVAAPIYFTGLLVGCASRSSESDERSGAAVEDTVAVQTAVVGRHDIEVSKTYAGTLEGQEQANIVAKISERITAIEAQVGSMAKEGDVVIVLDKSGASSQYYQAEANFTNASKNLERMKSLYGEGAISLQTLDASKTAYDIAKANFEAAKGAVELSAPISGIVTAVNVSVGDLATPGSPLVTLANTDKMKAIFYASEVDIQSLSIGQPVQIFSEFRPNQIMEGRLNQIAMSADVRSRSFELKALFSNTRDSWFKPGMFVKVNIQLESRRNVLAVPNQTIIHEDEVSRVFVVENQRAVRRDVKTGITNGSMTEVTVGLSEGDEVVTQGMNNLKDGSPVIVVNKKDQPFE